MKTEAAKRKRLQGMILGVLHTEYPGAMDSVVLKFALKNLGWVVVSECLKREISILAEKHLIEFAEPAEGICWVRILPAGIDAIEAGEMEVD